MNKMIRRLARVADSSQRQGDGKTERGRRGRFRVPGGHVPVCVGEEMERFAVPAELLGRPAFVELLRRSAQEYGYEQVGVLRIPCSVDLFRRVLLDAGETGDLAWYLESDMNLVADLNSVNPNLLYLE